MHIINITKAIKITFKIRKKGFKNAKFENLLFSTKLNTIGCT